MQRGPRPCPGPSPGKPAPNRNRVCLTSRPGFSHRGPARPRQSQKEGPGRRGWSGGWRLSGDSRGVQGPVLVQVPHTWQSLKRPPWQLLALKECGGVLPVAPAVQYLWGRSPQPTTVPLLLQLIRGEGPSRAPRATWPRPCHTGLTFRLRTGTWSLTFTEEFPNMHRTRLNYTMNLMCLSSRDFVY